MKKTLYTLNIDNYAPEITQLTYPMLRLYAEKIGAEFYVISERKFPERYTHAFEKLQIYDLARERADDWAIYIDSDALVHPDLFDPTEMVSKDTVLHNGVDLAGNRWKFDNYFRRDGRHLSSCNWLAIASDWCLDLWHPLDDMTYDEAMSRIFPLNSEVLSGITREHLIDDYVLSRNIAKYGLKFATVSQLLEKIGRKGENYFHHEYTIPVPEKVASITKMIDRWKITRFYEDTADRPSLTDLRMDDGTGVAVAGAAGADAFPNRGSRRLSGAQH